MDRTAGNDHTRSPGGVRGGPRTSTAVLCLLAAAVAGVVTGAVVSIGTDNGVGPGSSSGQQSPTETVSIEASVASFDPKPEGSGFRDRDGTWTTQRYTTAQFGALKDGVGLLVDVGDAREVAEFTMESATPGLAVELLAGDEPPTDDVAGLTSTDALTTATGPVTLSGAGGGAHRYWLLWVTQLAPSGGGFAAQVTTPVLTGPPA